MSTEFRIPGSPMNPEGRWFRTETNGGPSPLAIVRERFILGTVFLESGSEGPLAIRDTRRSLTAGDGLTQASQRRGLSFLLFLIFVQIPFIDCPRHSLS